MRKVVTIVFSGLKDRQLGEASTQALREVMTRYFDAMREEAERRRRIEKFIGDAVMAVDATVRDDALRAVRAAAGMQDARGAQRGAAGGLQRTARQPRRREHRRGGLRRPVDGSASSRATP
jgi:hypothetical protein